jgi:hypothetical protein
MASNAGRLRFHQNPVLADQERLPEGLQIRVYTYFTTPFFDTL